MNTQTYSSLLIFFLYFMLPFMTSAQVCQRTCGSQILKYPFGSDPGCGDPRFQPHVSCSQGKLSFSTHTGSYTVTQIDYDNQVLYISDPTMSTCSCTVPSKGFGLDWDAPFAFHDTTIFTLLDCSSSSSTICKVSGLSNDGNSSKQLILCDQGTPICSLLYSCRPDVVSINLPVNINTCCVYTPVNLGPAFEMDLQKLQCNSYSGFYSFNEQESNPQNWKYGIALKYRFSVTSDDYPSSCDACEKSYGVCGYNANVYNSFICNCPNGINTTNDCYLTANYNNGIKTLIPFNDGGSSWLIQPMAWFLSLIFF